MSETETETRGNEHRFATGDVLHGRYEIQRVLGRGGFAVIYGAFDQTIQREVAIKVLNLHQAVGSRSQFDQVLGRFQREARLAARIRHPSIVEIYDFGVLDDGEQPYIIMEFLEGRDLEQEIFDNGPLAPTRLLPLFCDALDALGEAHDEGVVHKDLKPANLFVSRPGSRKEALKLVDFGIAHVNAPGEERMTKTGLMSGTPQYLPPEYVESQEVTPAMDIYQMGLILIEALSGEACVQESSPFQAAYKHVERDLIIPAPLLRNEFGDVLERALAYDIEDRFSTAEDFSDALAAVEPDSIPRIEPGSTGAKGPLSPVADTDAYPADEDKEWNEEAFAGTLAGVGPDEAKTPEEPRAKKNPSVQLRGNLRDSYEGFDAEKESTQPDDSTADGRPPTRETADASVGRGTIAVIGVLVLLLLVAMGGLAFLVMTQSELGGIAGETEETAEVVEQPEESDKPSAEHIAAEDHAYQSATALADDVADIEWNTGPEEFSIELVSTPTGVDVTTADGTSLGSTPLEVVVSDDEEMELELRRSGYRMRQVTVDESDGDRLEIELDRRRAQRPTPEPTPEPEADDEGDEELTEQERRRLQLAP